MVGWASWAGWAGWAGWLLGCVVHPNSPRARAAATGMLAGQPLEPPNPIFHRLLLWDDRPAHDSVTKCPVASSQSPGGHPVTGPSTVSSLLAAKLLVHCQMPTSPLTGQSWLLFLETERNPCPPFPSTVFSSISSFSICCVTTHYYG